MTYTFKEWFKHRRPERIERNSEKMYQMLKCIHEKRLIPENWKSHYKDLEDLFKEIEGDFEENFDARMPSN